MQQLEGGSRGEERVFQGRLPVGVDTNVLGGNAVVVFGSDVSRGNGGGEENVVDLEVEVEAAETLVELTGGPGDVDMGEEGGGWRPPSERDVEGHVFATIVVFDDDTGSAVGGETTVGRGEEGKEGACGGGVGDTARDVV